MPVVLPEQSDLAVKVGGTLGHVFAVCLTFVRLYLRSRHSRIWWDDVVVFVAAIADVLFMVSLWAPYVGSTLDEYGFPLLNIWWYNMPCFTSIWLSRISLWLSLSRIYPPQDKTRRLVFSLAAIFAVAGTICILLLMFGCEGSSGGTRFNIFLCYGYNSLSTYDKLRAAVMSVDMAADLALVLVPAYLISDVRLPRKEKFLIILLGSGTLLTMINLTVVVFVSFGPFERNAGWSAVVGIVVHTASYVTLTAANILVVGTAIYRCLERRNAISTYPTTTTTSSRPNGPPQLTVFEPAHTTLTYPLTELSTMSDIDEGGSRRSESPSRNDKLLSTKSTAPHNENYTVLSTAHRRTI